VDGKMRAEVGAYAWIEEHCPEIPAPKLHGFAFSANLQVYPLIPANRVDHLTHHLLIVHASRAQRRLHPRPVWIEFGHLYLLLEYIDRSKGKMLSETLRDHRDIHAG
jgi:hypothetical protein